MADLDSHWQYLTRAWRAAQGAPLSVRKTMLVISLADAFIDRLFENQSAETDVLAYRSGLADRSAALGLVMDIAAHRANGPVLRVRDRPVPIEQYQALSVEDFMVSLYNGNTVQQIVVCNVGSTEAPVLELLETVLSDLEAAKDQVLNSR